MPWRLQSSRNSLPAGSISAPEWRSDVPEQKGLLLSESEKYTAVSVQRLLEVCTA